MAIMMMIPLITAPPPISRHSLLPVHCYHDRTHSPADSSRHWLMYVLDYTYTAYQLYWIAFIYYSHICRQRSRCPWWRGMTSGYRWLLDLAEAWLDCGLMEENTMAASAAIADRNRQWKAVYRDCYWFRLTSHIICWAREASWSSFSSTASVLVRRSEWFTAKKSIRIVSLMAWPDSLQILKNDQQGQLAW